MNRDLCPCGQPLHYSNPWLRREVDALIRQHGPTATVTTPGGSFQVPRHYIALHGLKADELPELAREYGWEAA